MNIKDFEYLVSLEQHRHFGRAADACFVSQPTLSGQIKKLEQTLGVSVVERTSRSLVFTAKGLALVAQAKEILKQVKVFKKIATEGGGLSGPLHLGVIPTVGPYFLPLLVEQLTRQYPSLELFIHEAHTDILIEQLNDGTLDCVLFAETPDTQSLKTCRLYEEPLVLAVHHEHVWANHSSLEMNQLAGQSLLVLENGHCLQEHALQYCLAAGASDDERFKASSLETIRHMVAAGVGMTMMPLSATLINHSALLHYVQLENPMPRRHIILATRNTSSEHYFDELAVKIKSTIEDAPHFYPAL